MTRLLSTLALVLMLAVPATAAAKPKAATFTIRGAGFGHGVGMSQYGAMGYALHGWTAPAILAHYYTGTALGTTDPAQTVRVLLADRAGSARISGATQAGTQTLDPAQTYTARARGLTQVVLSAAGKKVATFTAPLQFAGANGITSLGGKPYRGVLALSPGAFGGLTVIDAVGLDDYVQGVVPGESPASWPAEALKAQAIAARTYAITTKRGATFDVYPDTRSQMYGGVSVETPATNQAVADTRGQVVTYAGKPVVTFFFSTSGGQTEDIENTPLGTVAEPWLRSVDDPYDTVSPRHRWTPTTMTLAAAAAKLGSLVKGSFRGITVDHRGVSPRIMTADIVGTKGTTTVSGATLRDKFGLFDTWAYFTTITAGKKAPTPVLTNPQAADPSGGTVAGLARFSFRLQSAGILTGTVLGARRGTALDVQQLQGSDWVSVARTRTRRGGAYGWTADDPGTYRVVRAGAAGPAVRIG